MAKHSILNYLLLFLFVDNVIKCLWTKKYTFLLVVPQNSKTNVYSFALHLFIHKIPFFLPSFFPSPLIPPFLFYVRHSKTFLGAM